MQCLCFRAQLSLHRIPGSLNDVRLAPGRVHLLSVFWAPGPRQGRCPRGQKASRSSWARECHGFNLSHYQRQMTLDRVESVREHGRALRGPSPSPPVQDAPPPTPVRRVESLVPRVVVVGFWGLSRVRIMKLRVDKGLGRVWGVGSYR